jgi:5-methylcytosine-specific restriction endonuclease McrA
MTDGKCVYCDVPLAQDNFEVDHFVPKSSDGPDHINNFVPSCQSCNMTKRDKHPVQFIREKLGRNVVRFNPNTEVA